MDVYWRYWGNLILSSDPSVQEEMISGFPPANILIHFTQTLENQGFRNEQMRRSGRIAINHNERTNDRLKRIKIMYQALGAEIEAAIQATDQEGVVLDDFWIATAPIETSDSQGMFNQISDQNEDQHAQ
jgi:hypothetical protein